MAQHFLSDVDFHKKQLLHAVIEKSAVAPSGPVEGQIYYDTVDKVVKQYDGTQWRVMGDTYTLPTASAEGLGGIKVGSNLAIDANGVLTSQNVVEITITSENKSTYTNTYLESNYLDEDIVPILNIDGYLYYNVGVSASSIVFFNLFDNSLNYVMATSEGIGEVTTISIQEAITFNTAYDATTNKAATMTDIANAISALGTVLDFKGVKATYAEIEAIVDPENGDMWLCTADNSEYVYVAGDPTGHWEQFGPTIDLSGYVQIADLVDDIATNASETEKAPSVKGVADFAEAKTNKITNLNSGSITNDQYPTANAVNNKLALGAVDVPAVSNVDTTCTPLGNVSVSNPSTGESGDIAVIDKTASPVAAASITSGAATPTFSTLSAAMSTTPGEEETLVFTATGYGFSAEDVYNSAAVVEKKLDFTGSATTVAIPNTVAAAGSVAVTFTE